MIAPTSTASSTSDVINAGVDTETSTPQLSLKSHSFRALLMRLMTRGTPNSCFESQLITRLSSSSPVAAIITSALRTSAEARLAYSQASAAKTLTPGSCDFRRSAVEVTCSIKVTSWWRSIKSSAIEVPTDPPPAITTFIVSSPRAVRGDRSDPHSSRETRGCRPLGRRDPQR